MQKQGAKVSKLMTQIDITQKPRINVKLYLIKYQYITKLQATFLRKIMRKKKRKP